MNEDGERITGTALNRMHSVAEGAFNAAMALRAPVGLDWADEERRRMGFGPNFVRNFVRPVDDEPVSGPAGP